MSKTLYKIWRAIKDYVYIVVIVLLIRTFIVTPAIVDGSSMNNTLLDGQVVLIDKLSYVFWNINRFDIVVVENKQDNDKIIKRVIGLPNETIEYKNNVLYINGKKSDIRREFEFTEDFIIETKDNEYFVLGDNRDISKDSRILGNFTKEEIVGKVNIRIYPLNRIGIVK